MTTTEPTLLDYTPSQDEEIARLTKLAETKNAQVEAILSDPVFQQAEANAKLLGKKVREIEKIRDDLTKITHQIQEANILKIAEPAEDGFYIYSKAERGYRRDGTIQIKKALLLKAFGEWFDLSDGSNSLPNWNGKAVSFEDFLDIDTDTVEVTLTKLEDTSKWPKELLKDEDGEGVEIAIEYEIEADDDTTTPDDESGTETEEEL